MAGAKITFPHDVTKAKRAQLRRKLLRQLMRATGVDKDARPRSFATSGDTSEST
jgi:hypothetical protein